MPSVNHSNNQYSQKQAQLVAEFKQRKHANESIALKKDTSNLFRNRPEQTKTIDVRDFNKVLHVDKENLIAEVEGMTTYADLVDATLAHDCLPTVVPELKSITIGGALSGVGIESSSFRYGLVHETIVEFDVLTGNGEVVTCRPDNEHRELFYAFPNSYGTLGYALKLKVKLIPIKPFVKLTHLRFSSPQQYYQKLNELCWANHKSGSVAYLDATVFNENEMYITQGEFVDEAPFVSDYKYMNIFYRSIQQKQTDFLTTKDYIWRWDTDWFWCSKVFGLQNPFLRLLLGKFMLNSITYWKIKNVINRNKFLSFIIDKLGKEKESVIQDVAIPIENATEFFHFFHENIGVKPLWNCPIIPFDTESQFPLFKMQPNQLYVNFGFWDMVPTNEANGYFNRLIEKKVVELGGIKSLYSNSFYSEDDFWRIYDKVHYHSLKKKYDSNALLKDLYSKCIEK